MGSRDVFVYQTSHGRICISTSFVCVCRAGCQPIWMHHLFTLHSRRGAVMNMFVSAFILVVARRARKSVSKCAHVQTLAAASMLRENGNKKCNDYNTFVE